MAEKKTSPKRKKPEKVWGFTVLSFFAMLGVYAAKFFVDFCVLPNMFPDWYPFSIYAMIAWIATAAVATIISVQFITRFGFFYPVADIMYALFILLWPMGLYGTANWPDAIVALLAAFLLDVIQRAVLWIYIAIDFMRM